jgi:hypothetical protein
MLREGHVAVREGLLAVREGLLAVAAFIQLALEQRIAMVGIDERRAYAAPASFSASSRTPTASTSALIGNRASPA